MFEKILNKIPYVKELKHENESFKSENQELRSYIGYLVNEAYIVMGNKDGRFLPVDLSTLEKYQDVEIKKVQLPPRNHLRIYAKIGKSTHKSTQ